MYRGKHPSALTSQKMLLDAFNDLLKTKKYKDVSVSELCSHCGVSRQTFYTLFGTKENLILYRLEQSALAKSSCCLHSDRITLAETCDSYSDFVISNYSQIKMLIDNNLMDVLNAYLSHALISGPRNFAEIDGEEREYASLFVSAGLCHLTRKYIQEHEKPCREELAQLAFKIMSGEIYIV